MAETRRLGTILVPLDGSEAGASALAMAGMLARVTGGPIRLLRVAATPRAVVSEGVVVAYEDQERARLRAEADDYLEGVRARLGGLPVETAVRFGDPAAQIVAEAEASGAGLIAMSTHGRSGLARALMGSVAESVVRAAPCPVVTLSPRAERLPEAPAPPAAGSTAVAQRRCLACARPSPVAFCPACEARIRGQALEHKQGEERAGRTGRAG